jgi:hypothetical protein
MGHSKDWQDQLHGLGLQGLVSVSRERIGSHENTTSTLEPSNPSASCHRWPFPFFLDKHNYIAACGKICLGGYTHLLYCTRTLRSRE